MKFSEWALKIFGLGKLQSGVADGATAVGFEFDTENELVTAGSEIVAFLNGSVKKLSIDKDGNIKQTGNLFYEGLNGHIRAHASNNFQIGATSGNTIQFAGTMLYLNSIDTIQAAAGGKTGITLQIAEPPNDSYVAPGIELVAAAAFPDATINVVGGDVSLNGGAGASASAGDAHGGDVNINVGIGYGTGHDGYVKMTNLPIADPAVAGALWNNAGVLNISAG